MLKRREGSRWREGTSMELENDREQHALLVPGCTEEEGGGLGADLVGL